jgi:hypothetical protein
MFKVFDHHFFRSDTERIAHLHDALTPAIGKDIGGALLNPGVYQHTLNELHKRYGNPQINGDNSWAMKRSRLSKTWTNGSKGLPWPKNPSGLVHWNRLISGP